jgi:5-hydroxytryptamine receptor 1
MLHAGANIKNNMFLLLLFLRGLAQVFATLSTFYLPLAIILFLYWRIFLTAKKRIRRRKEQRQNNGISSSTAAAAIGGLRLSLRGAVSSAAPTNSTTGTSNNTGISFVSTVEPSSCSVMAAAVGVLNLGRPNVSPSDTADNLYVEQTVAVAPQQPQQQQQPAKLTRRITSVAVAAVAAAGGGNRRRNMESKRERKAAKTLAIITGAFVVCWLPFFVIALLMPVCQWPHCYYDDNMVSFFLWLGYFNSTLNPILYTIFSPEFRNAFQKLLRMKSSRPRSSQPMATALSHSGGGGRTTRESRPNVTVLSVGPTVGNNNKFNDPERQSVAAASTYSG